MYPNNSYSRRDFLKQLAATSAFVAGAAPQILSANVTELPRREPSKPIAPSDCTRLATNGKEKSTPKIGLVVSGGAAKGAFAVGVIDRLQEKKQIQFDLVAGTSTGALIAPLVVSNNIAKLKQLYASFSSADILFEQRLEAMFRTGSIYDTPGLRSIAKATYTQEIWEKISLSSAAQMFITTVNLQTGRVVYFHNGPYRQPTQDADFVRINSLDMLLDAVLASAMIPVIMPTARIRMITVEMRDHQFVDGGVRETFPIKVLIDNGADEIYGIMLNAENEQGDDSEFTDLIKILKRTIDLLYQEVALADIRIAECCNQAIKYINSTRTYIAEIKKMLKDEFPDNDQSKKIDDIFSHLRLEENPFASACSKKIHLIRPKEKLIENSLIFSKADMRRMIRLGQEAVEEGVEEVLEVMSTC